MPHAILLRIWQRGTVVTTVLVDMPTLAVSTILSKCQVTLLCNSALHTEASATA